MFVGWDMSNERSMDTSDSFTRSIVEMNVKNTNDRNNGKCADFEISVGMSRKWNARQAGREVAENTLKKLNHKPSFFLLFSTIHYDTYGGFQEFIDGVWDILPETTTLIGGTVAGFMNTQGCFTRGCSAIAFYHPDIEISVGIGHNVKRNPQKAAIECIQSISNEGRTDDLFFEVISGPIIPTFPGQGKQTVINSKIKGNLFKNMIPTLFKANMGTDRADEFLENISKQIKNPLIGAVCYDDGQLLKNYQFHNNKIYKNSVILMKVSTDVKTELLTVSALKPRNVKIKVEAEPDKRVIKKINNKPATQELFNLLNWGRDNLRKVEKFYSQAFYYPFCYKKEDVIHAGMLGLILGENIYFANKIESNELELYGLTGMKIIEEAKNIFSKNTEFIYGVMCETYIETLGNSIYEVKDIIDKNTKEYLLLFAGGESIIQKDKIPHHLYESINILRV